MDNDPTTEEAPEAQPAEEAPAKEPAKTPDAGDAGPEEEKDEKKDEKEDAGGDDPADESQAGLLKALQKERERARAAEKRAEEAEAEKVQAERAALSEEERVKADLKDAQELSQKLEAELEKTRKEMSISMEAAKAGFADPADAVAHLKDELGELSVEEIPARIGQLLTDKPYLKGETPGPSRTSNSEQGNDPASSTPEKQAADFFDSVFG